MEWNITAQVSGPDRLARFWGQYFAETPLCAVCGAVAREVDPFFPYLDDLNRCPGHPRGITPLPEGFSDQEASPQRRPDAPFRRVSHRWRRCRNHR